jgi:hypothetical protein
MLLSWTRVGNRRTLFLHDISAGAPGMVLPAATPDRVAAGILRRAGAAATPERAEVRTLGSGLRLARSRPRAPVKSSRVVTSAAIRDGEDVTVIDKGNPHACWYSDRVPEYAADSRFRSAHALIGRAPQKKIDGGLPNAPIERPPATRARDQLDQPEWFLAAFRPCGTCSGGTGPRPAVFSALPEEQNSAGLSNCIPP